MTPLSQLEVLEQLQSPRFVMADTMDLWIDIARDQLLEVIARVDLLTLNESEALHLSGERTIDEAGAHLLGLGVERVLIKMGGDGSAYYAEGNCIRIPACSISALVDPTGAGDAFGGAFMGVLAEVGNTDEESIQTAMLYGSIVSARVVETFSLDGLKALTREAIDGQVEGCREIIA